VIDLLALAVRLGLGIAKAHGYVDGNKRTGLASLIEFLAINGLPLLSPLVSLIGRSPPCETA
jgi:death on curing protein